MWLAPAEADWMIGGEHDQGIHGYCITLTPQLLQRVDLSYSQEEMQVYLKQANCFYEGTQNHGLPMYYDDVSQSCISHQEKQSQLKSECLAGGNEWFTQLGVMGVCVDSEIGGGPALNMLRKRDHRSLTLKFNDMQVDLFRKLEFDRWFEVEMAEAPEQLKLWKRHFDNWADKRVAAALEKENFSSGRASFPEMFSETFKASDHGQEEMFKNFQIEASAFEKRIQGQPVRQTETIAKVNTFTADRAILSKRNNSEAKEVSSSATAFTLGVLVACMAAVGAGYVFKSRFEKVRRVTPHDTQEPLL